MRLMLVILGSLWFCRWCFHEGRKQGWNDAVAEYLGHTGGIY